MLEQAALREQFQTLLAREQYAAEIYGDLAGKVDDPALREQVEQLYREKLRHVRLTERLLEILE